MLRLLTSMFMRSSITSSDPIRPNSSMVVVMSCRWGMLPITIGSSVSRVAARMGRAAFFAPEILISPCNGAPPLMTNLSMAPLQDKAGDGRQPDSGWRGGGPARGRGVFTRMRGSPGETFSSPILPACRSGWRERECPFPSFRPKPGKPPGAVAPCFSRQRPR